MEPVPIRCNTLLQWCLGTYYVRQVTDAVLRARGRYFLARFERLRPSQTQGHILIGLIHRAQSTRFGRDHDFRRIRTVEDFRRLVPLRTAAELWRSYWQCVHPQVDGATWHGPATVEGMGTPRPQVTTPALLDATRRALQLALAFVVERRPATRLLAGQTLVLGDDLALSFGDEGEAAWLRPGWRARGLPKLLRPFTLLAAEPTGEVSEQTAALSLSCLVGSPSQVLHLFDRVRELTNRERVADVWPGMAAILCTRPLGEDTRARLRGEAGPRPAILEMAVRPEAIVAVEDPRYGLPRLLHDHGVFLEFVPAGESGQPRATRLGFDEVEKGVVYELAVTTPAGLWACRAGCSVVFERLDPPLVRFVEARRPLARRTDLAPVISPAPPPHQQTAGTGAALPETASHSPWSAPADQG
jgi:hypothetical protein